jgi:hypothetical protein
MPHLFFFLWQIVAVMIDLGELASLALSAVSLTAISKASYRAR